MNRATFCDNWWDSFPAVPATREDKRYDRIMRLYADHTLNGTDGRTGRSVYKHGGEDHLVLAFFENFVVDEKYEWISWVRDRAGMRGGPITSAHWSYAFEERVLGERRPRIADLVVHWRDDQGDAIVVIEAKRPGGVPRSGLNEKDRPSSAYYLQYSAMRQIPRKEQMLLIGARDLARLGSTEGRVITWEELMQLQLQIFATHTPPSLRSLVNDRLMAHFGALGLSTPSRRQAGEFNDTLCDEVLPSGLATWLRGSQAYFSALEGNEASPPFAWLYSELKREELLGRRSQSTRDRERALWKLEHA